MTLLLSMSAGRALAGPPATGEIFEEARRAFDVGLEHLKAERFDEAVAAFERSLELRESSVALYNLAIAERARSHPASALAALERWRAIVNPERTTPQELEAVDTMIRELGTEIAVIDLRIDGPSEVKLDGAPIALDGERALVRVDPGRHRVEARRPGYHPIASEVELARGQRKELDLRARWRALDAELAVVAAPANAEIRIDGVARGVGRFDGALAPGAHRIEVEAPDHQSKTERVELVPGETREIAVVLDAERPLYREWWLWASVAGGAVIAGTVVGILFANRPPPYDGGTIGETFEALRR